MRLRVFCSAFVALWALSSSAAWAQVNTTTTLGIAPASPVVGETVTFSGTVSPASGSTTPSGSVAVTFTVGGGSICTDAALDASGNYSCTDTFSSAQVGTSVTATFAPTDSMAFNASSTNGSLTVAAADTTLAVLAGTLATDSQFNTPFAASFSLTVDSPGSGSPTGTVTLTWGSDTCQATLPATSCNI
ncbi:MAG: Ig-like domain repeat protein, partial [Pseudomonadota bacterium]